MNRHPQEKKKMAFTFQINDGLNFNHDEALLAKAEKLKPDLKVRKLNPTGLVRLTQDASRLEGTGTEPDERVLEEMQLAKGESFILDFGQHLVGHFSIDIESKGSPMDSPLYLQLRFAEVPAELSHESSEYNGWLARSWIQEEFIHVDELPATMELPRRYAFRFVEIRVLETSPKWKAAFKNPEAKSLTSASELPELPEVNDEELEKIRDIAIATLKDCMLDVFEDGPKRDRRLWLGDLRLQAKANYSSFRNMDLVKRCLYLFGAMSVDDGRISANVFVRPEPVPDDTFLFEYSLFFGDVLNDYLNEVSDQEALRDLYPIAKKQMDYALGLVDENGCLNLPESYPVFVDWSNEFNKKTAAQAIMIYELKRFIELAKKAEDETEAYEKKLKQMTEYALEHLYDSDRHLFTTEKDEINIASQVWMVLAGLLNLEENRKVMEAALENLFPVHGIATPYMYHYIAEALFEAGLYDEAVSFMKNYWGKMIEMGADTYWEAFDPDQPDYSPYGSPIISSYCHAWGCTPVYLIDKYILNKDHREN